MQPTMHPSPGRISGRPESISVAVVDPDARWSSRLAEDLKLRMGARVTTVRSPRELESALSGCHVLVLGRAADPGFNLLHELRERYNERELPIIYADKSVEDDGYDDDDHHEQATRAGANAVFDRSIHKNDFGLLEKLVYSLAYE